MALKVVHINKDKLAREAEAKTFWENVLKPKWEAQARKRAEKLLAELKAGKHKP